MNRKVLLGVVIVLGLVTAGIHGSFAVNMLTRPARGFGGRPPQAANGGQQGSGQFAGGPSGQASGGANSDANGGTSANTQGGQPGGQPGAGGPNGGGRQFQRGGGFAPGPLAFLFPSLGILFTLNVIGYLTLLALVALPIPFFKDHAALTHWLLIGFAVVTFFSYFGVNGAAAFRNTLGLICKADELLLMGATFLHLRSLRTVTPAPAAPAATAAA